MSPGFVVVVVVVVVVLDVVVLLFDFVDGGLMDKLERLGMGFVTSENKQLTIHTIRKY